MKEIESLRIYQLAVEIGEMVWQIVNSWEDKFAKWTVGKQWVESADSVSATMKEGYYRNQKGDLRKFFQYSFSSAKEAEHWLSKSYHRKLVSESQYQELEKKFQDYFPQTVNFINKIEK
jgi:four helix bundle protein